MTPGTENGHWEYIFTVPSGTDELNFVFTDGADKWDNNCGRDWSIKIP